jgi:hypothetical protein
MKRWLWGEKGQQLVQVALLLPLLLAFLGLVVDVGNVYVHHQMVRNAADAAAVAGATVLYRQGAQVAIETAEYYAAQHGYDNNGTTNTVRATVPPVSGSFAGNPQYIQVRIEEQVAPFFASLVWDGTFRVSASAVAGWQQQQLEASTIVLNETACGALSAEGNHVRLVAQKGNIHVNSNCSSAVALGNGDVWSETRLTIRGGYVRGPNGRFLDLLGRPLPPATGQPLLPDPLENLPAPDPSGISAIYEGVSISGGNVTLRPGIYNGGITVLGSANVTLEPGIYILNGDFKVSGTAQVTGHDVFIYLASGTINFDGTGALQLDAPDDGTYEDVLIFQARGNTAPSYIRGTPAARLEGIIYLPDSKLTLRGNAALAADLVVDLLSLDGNPDLVVLGFDSRLWATISTALVE